VTPLDQLHERLGDALVAVLGFEGGGVDPIVRRAKDPSLADYQANAALSLAKQHRRNPRELATEIAGALEANGLVESADVAGPGFINVKLTGEALGAAADSALADPRLDVPRADPPLKTVVDYSAPNVAKEMHVGHLRSTIIGDALARTLEFLGHPVIRQNHLGDWGTQFGMLTQHLVETGASPSADLAELAQLYQEAKQHFDDDPDFAERARRRVVALQSGDEETLRLWRQLVDTSLDAMHHLYDRLGVTLTREDIAGESKYNPFLAEVTAELGDSGIAVEDQGARVVWVEGHEAPLMVVKSDGGYGYGTTDLAAIRYRSGTLQAERLIYVTDARQATHFAMVFDTAGRAGWLGAVVPEHAPFGTVLGENGRPFKTREGGTVSLESLLDEAVERARAIVEEKSPDLDEPAKHELAEAIGIGAVKYADLSSGRQRDYVFSIQRMVALNGNTGPYLQYAHVRTTAIARRAADKGITAGKIAVGHEAERALVLRLLEFAGAVEDVATTLEPHRLCTYLYDLADEFSVFYENCSVIKAETEELRSSRLALVELTSRTLAQGLGLLGIRTVERM
jgi:arginyl-tRNA synthetase